MLMCHFSLVVDVALRGHVKPTCIPVVGLGLGQDHLIGGIWPLGPISSVVGASWAQVNLWDSVRAWTFRSSDIDQDQVWIPVQVAST